ncbi:dense granular protein GRA10 [Cryptosporidium felis]|nr:dense granular protein GRA10 [Cryptosporidium felis]
MSVYYRFLHEKSDSYRAIELSVSSVRTSDLKVLVAEHAGLGKEYMKLFDLKVFDNDEKETFPDDKLLPIYSRVVIQRIPWRELKEIHHEAQRTIVEEEDVEFEAEPKLTLPQEYICKLCGYPLLNPVLVKCAGGCGASACRDCVKNYLDQNKAVTVKPCPSCGQRFRGSVPNKSLANVLATIEWEKFNYPVRDLENTTSKDFDGLAKGDGPSENLEAIMCDSSATKAEEESKQRECVAIQGSTPDQSNASNEGIAIPQNSLPPRGIFEDPDSLSLVSQLPSAESSMTKVAGAFPGDHTLAEDGFASVLPPEPTPGGLKQSHINLATQQTIETTISSTQKNQTPAVYSNPSVPLLPSHHPPPPIATHQLPHPGVHPPPFMDPWNMQGHPYPVPFNPEGGPHHFHPGYPGTAFAQPGPGHPYGYIMQPPNLMNPGVYPPQAHFQPYTETIAPICGPYLTEEQRIQLAMSFPLLSEENFNLIKQAQQSVKDIWSMLPKSVRSSLLQETPDLGNTTEKKNKPFKKRKEQYNQNGVVNSGNSNNGSANSYSKQHPGLKKRST